MMNIFGNFIHASSTFMLIFKFSSINSVRNELLAWIPPTLAAALIRTSGLYFSIKSEVSSNENKFASLLLKHEHCMNYF